MNIPGYDTHIFRAPEPPHQICTDPGDMCNRTAEPDEDAPRGYRPKPCRGEMINEDGVVMCCECGEVQE